MAPSCASGCPSRTVRLTGEAPQTLCLRGKEWFIVGIPGLTAGPEGRAGIATQAVRRLSASAYFSAVSRMTSGGSRGPGARLSQSSVSR